MRLQSKLSVLFVMWIQVSHCQDEPLPLVSQCEIADLTKENWIANDVDSTILGTPGFGARSANFPNAFLNNFQPKVNFQCTDFSSSCEVGNFLSLGTSIGGPCAAFANSNPRIGFIAQAWINIHNNLKNIHNAVAQAVDEIKASSYIDDICNEARPNPLPIPRSTLLKLAELSLIFLPAPPVGAVSATFRAGIKGFDEFAGQTLNFAQPDIEPNHGNQPQILRALLEQISPWVQNNARAQNAAIFTTFHAGSENTIRNMLLGGDHMATPPTEAEYKSFMVLNIKLYLMAQLWGNNGIVFFFDPDEDERSCAITDLTIFVPEIGCTAFLHKQSSRSSVSPSFDSDAPRSRFAGFSQKHFGLDALAPQGILRKVQLDIINCHKAGGDQSRVDFEAFLSSSTADIPPCLFGISVREQGT